MSSLCYFCGSDKHKSSDCPQYVMENFHQQEQEQELEDTYLFYSTAISLPTQQKLLLFHHHDDDTLFCNTITPASNIF
ncbi:hypothetical protein BDF21DRAFT_490726 [Thamnidium elegans]|nr:hypothetical protein BDF21DRAFT_490726 [Thamnidium elegans]